MSTARTENLFCLYYKFVYKIKKSNKTEKAFFTAGIPFIDKH